ncbi:hypothetical protein [Flavobacterium sp.]|uniref:hypothetical protein n=1 Tax=Flavobacterium sp. TaxID=239 RepID=UPI00286C0C76|nr:hypothetical protein [Flavobacterium sp.]
MKAINFLRALMFAVSILFISCEDEPVDPQTSIENTNVVCSDPSNVTATRSTNTTMATVLWDDNGDQHSWQVQYGNSGFVLGSGTTVYSNAPSKIFTGLLETAGYDFYVRSQCFENQYSNWIGPITVPPLGVITTEEYWPRAQQNQWIFSVDNVNQQPWKIVSTDVINDNTYYTFQLIDGEPIRRIRKSAVGDYFDRYDDYTDADTTISGNETIILKDYLPVNSSWTNTYTETTTTIGLPPEDLSVEVVSTILERGASVTVPSGTFNDVIIVKRVKTATSLTLPTTVTTTTYWFAKNHGPVQVQTEIDGVITIEKLAAHILY